MYFIDEEKNQSRCDLKKKKKNFKLLRQTIKQRPLAQIPTASLEEKLQLNYQITTFVTTEIFH